MSLSLKKTSYFALDCKAEITPNPFIEAYDNGLFILDLLTGELSPSNEDDYDDEFFELVDNEITPTIL